ncbi:MAG TPA: Flp pilus assembly protein CpaB [Syntrophomonadaceae bacterium]|nr:Flp pilus assembly protein CpaB [Syntrophomonadaceae bacterium]HPR92805.1 Flp pilus assembly protein CpaB [Syntrophomonadaceae bacterium]
MRNKLIIIIAIIFGLLAAFLAYGYLNNVNETAAKKQYSQVVTAAQDIPANTAVTRVMLETKPFPTELRNGKEIVEVDEAVGKISPSAINKGEVLLESRLIDPGESMDQLSYVIPNGLRAMSIPVNEVTGVANMIARGDRVDVVTVVPAAGENPFPYAVTVLQNIEVLAVSTSISPPKDTEKVIPPETVTVAVDPQSALKLKLAMQTTNFSLVLRSPVDRATAETVPFALNQF